MGSIEKHTEKCQSGKLATYQEPPDGIESSGPSLIKPIFRRWKIVLVMLVLISAAGVPLVWYTVKPYYQASGAIRITPVIPNILVGGAEVMPMYKNFKATQAALITSDEVLNRVADNLIEQNPEFFESLNTDFPLKNRFLKPPSTNPIRVLRSFLNGGQFTIEPEGDTELIKISMKSQDSAKAEKIVNAFIRAYMSVVVTKETEDENQKLSILENERKILLARLDQQKQDIRELALEYGTQSLTMRQEITLQRVGALRSKLTEFETRKITLQIKTQLLEKNQDVTIGPQDMIKLRHEFSNADLMVQSLTSSIAQIDQGLILSKQQLAAGNPEIERKEKLLEAMKQRLETRRQEVNEMFNDIVSKEFSQSNREELEDINTELEQINIYEDHLRSLMAEEDSETIKLGHKQLAIEDLQDQFKITKEMYDTVRRRIQELEMERKRPARISEAYYAQNVLFQDERLKYSAAVVFGALASGLGLALLRDRFDLSLRTTEDISDKTSIRILGTTTNLSRLKQSSVASQIADDYLTICTNLKLACDGKIPQKLVVCSSRAREGKTTFSVNLAAALAKSDKRVLLIDGDLRKPDLSKLLNVPAGSSKLQDMLWKDNVEHFICTTRWRNIDVLPSSVHDSADIYKLLSQQRILDVIDKLSLQYDHIIIDTSPIMVFSDALLWAKIAGTVVLTSFSGFTTGTDLTESVERIAQTNAFISGVVLNSVRVYQGYNSYGSYGSYGYERYGGQMSEKQRIKSSRELLPADKETTES